MLDTQRGPYVQQPPTLRQVTNASASQPMLRQISQRFGKSVIDSVRFTILPDGRALPSRQRAIIVLQKEAKG